MKLKHLILAAAVLLATACSTSRNFSDGIIRTDVPVRPAGQQNVIGLTVPALETVHIGIVGIGMRGTGAVSRLSYVPGVKIVALCDVEPERVSAGQQALVKRGLPKPEGYSGSTDAYKQLCERPDVDLVYICTDWLHHVPVALYAMNHGKNAAVEVPAATSMEDIWALINTSERTRKHCMMLENCCYDFYELSCLAMAQAGLFGEVLHGEGAYLHNLDPFWDRYWSNWRLDFNRKHEGDVYPTHGFGPVCQVLNIHRGDRLKTLVAMDTKSVNGPRAVKKLHGEEAPDFKNGDQTSTLIRTEKGKTILIEHSVLTPRPYSRMYQLVGTDGYAAKYPIQEICLRLSKVADPKNVNLEDLDAEKSLNDKEIADLQKKYPNPILTPELVDLAKKVGGHGGMDFIMDYRLVYCLRNGLPLDMDVYDLAEWCCVGPLGALSIENGNRPVEIPDFTRGAWNQVPGFSYAFAK